ncbi:MAG: sigma-70 family RNA polymerase sigma factor [Chitinophagales bacterium]
MELNANLSDRAKEDLDLVERARSGDQSAFTELMVRYRDSIHYMLLKMVHNRDDAEDLAIEAFGKAFLHLDKYTPDYAFSTWLFKIASNNAIDFIRKKKVQTLSLDDQQDAFTQIVSSNMVNNAPDPEEIFIKDQRAALLRTILQELSPKYRTLVELRYFDELSYEEIAEKQNLPLGTVKATLFRARDLLFEILKEHREKM